jgi:hypothetical protein
MRNLPIDERFAGTMAPLISQEELDRLTPKPGQSGYVDPNPCVRLFGKGPEGAKCKKCVHLVRMLYGHTVLKCEERGDLTHGPKTDQRSGWNACSKFESGENQIMFMR